ncbi:MBL fold metallo-hydrolase [Fictibacillus sp. WQ 8-8]|uniref:MBL fold metallo-hydrolase n=1 Tax=Fictibacillus sp. WQ 8-8 TaxID=2938788 RepID=UPI002109C104|nr:MBL fold metallo-hydrolase [Fictibacillus sp. WQ 8-8]MCQ6265184.1 MBL fold metallo-hydrolase [Fictibacillus sp. WQ 8-8]
MDHVEGSASTNKYIPVSSVTSGEGIELAPDIYSYTNQIVNLCFIGKPENGQDWVLVDAGMPDSAEKIIYEAEERFGKGSRPKAIILTHAHFDHIGGIIGLLKKWDVPVYAHRLELPYVTGKKDYQEPDPSVEGGMVAKMSFLFPHESIDLDQRVTALPEDGSVPEMPGWRWIHTPGHTDGHISLFRDSDKALIAGDAFITVKQEDLYSVIIQELEISGPPRYFTPDWMTAWQSVKKLESLHPAMAVTGHGRPVKGEWLSQNLTRLARDFDKIAIPDYGKYVGDQLPEQ